MLEMRKVQTGRQTNDIGFRVALGLSLFNLVSSQDSWDAELHMHDPVTAAKFNAYCLDGTRGGFYYRPATSVASQNRWKIHYSGGGWAFDEQSLVSRSKTLLGSSSFFTPFLSKFWPPEGAGFYGLMGVNDTTTADWNFVWLPYCDGTSQTSDRTDPLVVGNVTLMLRGRALLDAHLFELERLYNFLSTATEVIVSGTSAGGLSARLHSSYIKSQLQVQGVKIIAAPDASWWWDSPNIKGLTPSIWLSSITPALTLWNATLRGSGAQCLEELTPVGNASHCFTLPYMHAYSDVPFYHIQSMYDTANLGICGGLNCNLVAGQCTEAEESFIQTFHVLMAESLLSAEAKFGDRDGHYLTSCYQHEQSCRGFDWFGINAGTSTTLEKGFAAFYKNGGSDPESRIVDAPWPNDYSCTVGDHGAC